MPGEAASSIAFDLAPDQVPMALATLHRDTGVGDRVWARLSGSEMPPLPFAQLLVGAGFDPLDARDDEVLAVRIRSLADTVGAHMRVLVCGANPSLHAADAGVGYAGPGNRFWPAAVAAGLVDRPFDPAAALDDCGVGMTDLVKRAAPRASELRLEELRDGLARVEALVRWLRPRVVCMVGLDGWRRTTDRRAGPGLQPDRLGDRPVYLIPSTSGLNARTRLDDLVAHLHTVVDLSGH